MSTTFLDYNGLELFIKTLSERYVGKDNLDEIIMIKTFSDWENIPDKVLPSGTILVYKDRTYIDGIPVPDLKIANGVTTIRDLPFLVDRDVDRLLVKYVNIIENNNVDLYFSGSTQDGNEIIRNTEIYANGGDLYATTFHGKLSNYLQIGDYKYDGSANVEIPTYGGE